jgi:hypothetical protein
MPGAARLNTTQQVGYLDAIVTYSDAGIAAGTKRIGTLPKGAMVTQTKAQMLTVSTAGAALTVGSASGTATSIATAGDINETTTALQTVAGVGVLSTSDDLDIYAKWTGATAGVAAIAIEYVPFRPQAQYY